MGMTFSFAPAGARSILLGASPIAGAMGYCLTPLRGFLKAAQWRPELLCRATQRLGAISTAAHRRAKVFAAEQRQKLAHSASYGYTPPNTLRAPAGAAEHSV